MNTLQLLKVYLLNDFYYFYTVGNTNEYSTILIIYLLNDFYFCTDGNMNEYSTTSYNLLT